jgi:hypothetical protein
MNARLFLILLFALVASCVIGAPTGEDRRDYPKLFERAAREFDVPADVLKGVAFAETRWAHMTWPAGETASPCNGMPRPFGIMSLWDSEHFGHTLREAAALIGQPVEVLKADVFQNMRGGAALLKKLYDEQTLPEGTTRLDIESWRNAIATYCGIPQPSLAQQHALDVFAFMNRGYDKYGIEWPGRHVKLEPIRAAVEKVKGEAVRKVTKPGKEAGGDGGVVFSPAAQPDYPGAIWRPAYSGHWYTTGNPFAFVVIHDMEGYYLSTISYIQRETTQVSIHYCVNGLKDYASDAAPGEVTQMVEERYWAWHAVCWNRYMVGIEHEGFVDNPAWYTEEMYQASANLTRYLCDKYGIPKDRNHIIAHGQKLVPGWTTWMAANWPQIDATCNSHTDPGANWNWTHYMELILGQPVITADPTNQIKSVGQTATFSVTASGAAPMTYRWWKDGVRLSSGGSLSGAGTATLTNNNVQITNAGFYTCVVSNAGGAVTSQPAQLVISATPLPVGAGTGLRAHVFDNPDFTSLKRVRIDATVNFDWGAGAPSSTTDADSFSIRWTGQVQPRHSQTYTFHTSSDDGVRLWVNGVLLIDKWQDQSETEWTGSIALTAGQKYDLRLEYFENSGPAAAKLYWSSMSQVKEIIPQTQLYRPPPVLALTNQIIAPGGALNFTVTPVDFDRYLSSQPIADFEEFADGQASVMFRPPGYSGSTDEFLDSAETNYTSVIAALPAGNSSGRALKARWAFTSGPASEWLRLTTANTPDLPNPVVDFGMSLLFDAQADRAMNIAVGIRETGSTNIIGGDGGQNGGIEFVGISGLSGGSPMPLRTLTAGNWMTLRFDLTNEPARSFSGGNGVLSSTNNHGALEHIAITPADGPGVYRLHLDNFVMVQPNPLTFVLEPGAPAGASINSRTGQLTWTPGTNTQSGSYPFTVRVTDGGSPSLTTTQTFLVTVEATPVLSITRLGNGTPRLTWNSVSGRSYRVLQKALLSASTWQDLATVTASGATTTYDAVQPTTQRFYRVERQ